MTNKHTEAPVDAFNFDTRAGLPAQLQRGLSDAQAQAAENAERGLQDAIAVVKVATAERDSSQNARFRYDRNYERMRQALRHAVLTTGKSYAVPAYLPAPKQSEQSVTVGPSDIREDVIGAYRETGGRGKSPGVLPDFSAPEGAQHQAWLSTQGAAPVDTSGMSPDDAAKAKRKRAGVSS